MSEVAAVAEAPKAGLDVQLMMDAGVHFGHLRKKWNPKMLPNIFMERKGIHIIDLNKTNDALVRSAEAMKNIARSGRKILFVATKKQAKEIVLACAESVKMPYVTERWLGGMLTNFATIKKSIKKMQSIERMLNDGSVGITKKERLVLTREREKLSRVLGGIEDLNRIPAAIFLVDIGHEHIALSEAKRLGLVTFGMVDTNCNPHEVDYAIPSNDDASKSVLLITNFLIDAIKEGLAERKDNKDASPEDFDDEFPMEKEARDALDRLKEEEKDARRRSGNRGGGNRGGGPGGPGGNRGPGGGNRGPGGPGGNRGPGGGGGRR